MNTLLRCACYSFEHIIEAEYDKELNTLDISFHLVNNYTWYQRIWIAIKYIFGYKSKYGNFDTFMITGYQKQEWIDLLNKLK